MGKHDRMLCWGCLFYLFPLICGEREGKRKGERQTNREEKRLPANSNKSEWVKGVTAAPYQKNKENELSRKNGSMNSLHAKKKTANSRHIEILLWGEK